MRRNPRRGLYSFFAILLLGSAGIAIFSDETILSAAKHFVIPSAFILSQLAYSRFGPNAGFGTAVLLSVSIMSLAATLRYFLWPNEGESAMAYIGLTGLVIGLLWGVVMPIFTPPYRNSAE